MARMLLLTTKDGEKDFSLILGATKSDMNLSCEEREKKVQERITKTLDEIKVHKEENEGAEVLVTGFGFAD